MIDHSAKMRICTEAYRSGIYTKNETIGAIIDLLADVSDFRVLWSEVPDWAQSPIRDYLMTCEDSSVIYDSSSKSSAPISPRLLELKRWLASRTGGG